MRAEIICLFLSFYTFSLNAEKIIVVAENAPPLQYVNQQGEITGLAADILTALLAETHSQAEIQLYPWARAYQIAQQQPNVMLLSVTRTKQRESLFKWVGSMIHLQDNLYRLKQRNEIVINQLDDAKKYQTGVPIADLQTQYLLEQGFQEEKNLVLVSQYQQAIKMLLAGHIDLIMGSAFLLNQQLRSLGEDPDKLTIAYSLNHSLGDLAIAFSLQTSDEQVKKFTQAFNRLEKNGRLQQIVSHWSTRLSQGSAKVIKAD